MEGVALAAGGCEGSGWHVFGTLGFWGSSVSSCPPLLSPPHSKYLSMYAPLVVVVVVVVVSASLCACFGFTVSMCSVLRTSYVWCGVVDAGWQRISVSGLGLAG